MKRALASVFFLVVASQVSGWLFPPLLAHSPIRTINLRYSVGSDQVMVNGSPTAKNKFEKWVADLSEMDPKGYRYVISVDETTSSAVLFKEVNNLVKLGALNISLKHQNSQIDFVKTDETESEKTETK
jgi:hypothetical protein